MRSSARVEVARRDGRDVVVDARSEPPFAIRRTPERVLLVGSAAAPVGGDVLDLDVVVGSTSCLVLGTAAATVVWPGPSGEPSRYATRCRVDDSARLELRPEPMVVVAGSRHHTRTDVTLAGSSTAIIVEEVSLGRTGEEPGHVELELRVTRDGRPLVHHAERLGPGVPGWGSAVAVGDARHLISMVLVGVAEAEPRTFVDAERGSGACLPVADDAVVVFAVGPDRLVARRAAAAVTPP